MAEYQQQWAQARDRLTAALAAAGYPTELSEIMAKQLKSLKAIDRMTAYMRHGYARNMEMLADEMLVICVDAENWREKKENQEAQAKYNAYLFGWRTQKRTFMKEKSMGLFDLFGKKSKDATVKLTEEEFLVLAKAMHDVTETGKTNQLCPRCGGKIIVTITETTTSAGCETVGCIKETHHGI